LQAHERLNICEDIVTSALGVIWNQLDDAFLFTFASKQPTLPATKRSILSIASLFDPLVLLSPIIIMVKMILQELWILNLNWDESVPHSLLDAWTDYLESLNMFPTLQVPRCCLQNAYSNIQLHEFCDASIRTYRCCVYVRTDGFGCGHQSLEYPLSRNNRCRNSNCAPHVYSLNYSTKSKDCSAKDSYRLTSGQTHK